MPSRTDPILPNRRLVILGGAAALVLSACRSEEVGDASASRGGDRFVFKDTVGWTELGGRMAVVAFIPYLMSSKQRSDAISGRGVYPALEPYDPMIEMRFELDEVGASLQREHIKSVQLTFWHFATPAPVMRFEGEDFDGSNEISLVGLDGEVRKGGWAIGTVRGQKVVPTTSGRDVAYSANLKFTVSLG